jgi:hypothetical protein
MNRLLYILLFFISFDSHSQTLRSSKYSVEIKTDLDSMLMDQFSSVLENEVASIKLVSLKPLCGMYMRWNDSLSLETEVERCYFKSLIDFKTNEVDVKRFKTIVEINSEDVSKLLLAIYQPKSDFEEGACYEPRHGIVFYNNQNALIGYIEICFECSQIHVFGKVPYPEQMAYEDYMSIKEIFAGYMNDYMNKK